MLLVLFQLGQDRYALDAAQVEEVLPLIAIKQIPRAPMGIAGAITYRAMPVPVVDLSAMVLGRPCAQRMNTRIVVVRYGPDRLLGVLAEKVNHTMRCTPGQFAPSGVHDAASPYLGPVLTDGAGMIQLVQAADLLSEAVRAVLFAGEEAA